MHNITYSSMPINISWKLLMVRDWVLLTDCMAQNRWKCFCAFCISQYSRTNHTRPVTSSSLRLVITIRLLLQAWSTHILLCISPLMMNVALVPAALWYFIYFSLNNCRLPKQNNIGWRLLSVFTDVRLHWRRTNDPDNQVPLTQWCVFIQNGIIPSTSAPFYSHYPSSVNLVT